jgi:hypothetical protein
MKLGREMAMLLREFADALAALASHSPRLDAEIDGLLDSYWLRLGTLEHVRRTGREKSHAADSVREGRALWRSFVAIVERLFDAAEQQAEQRDAACADLIDGSAVPLDDGVALAVRYYPGSRNSLVDIVRASRDFAGIDVANDSEPLPPAA